MSPYFNETAKNLIGQKITVQTSDKIVQQGILRHVLPQYIVLEIGQVPFFIHTEQIIWLSLDGPNNF
ncbi:DUF2642 domain-containing protein [Lysinibacillus telephonicus]|uniref:DUF2642 domain-containing protein n=1 Tax=Lysinibacillus telephonicus TaxID=1714840 RepID=A0A431UWV1_9BACI|nr:DUF2642 domain-containing protein [Lysinibacillus telephonicus]